jgi:cytochrome c oxidase subunit III
MELVMKEQNKRLHPHKFTLLIGIGSIVMMFAGLTSAYIVKRNQVNWVTFEIPLAFWYSTAIMIASSGTLVLASKAFKDRYFARYRKLLLVTMCLGIAFVVMQVFAFSQLWQQGVTFTGNVAFSFLYTLVGLHAIHVLGGVIALIVIAIKALGRGTRVYSSLPVDLISTYWHFVDFLWLYLLVFLIMIR